MVRHLIGTLRLKNIVKIKPQIYLMLFIEKKIKQYKQIKK